MTNIQKWFLLFVLLLSFEVSSQNLEREFQDPPNSSRPRTWMHAMSGNMSKVGMTKDLEAISAAGQGGILLFNIANMIPYGNVPYDSEEHHEIIAHAAKECERLDLSFGVHNCDGWTSSGGPWIEPEESMKMVVFSERVVDGGKVDVSLKQPTTLEGYYRDIAVIAYPSLTSEVTDAAARPIVTSSDAKLDLALIRDGKSEGASKLRFGGEDDTWVTFDFGRETEISSFFASYFREDLGGKLEKSDDGKNFTPVKDLRRPTRIGKKKRIFNESFDPVRGRYFRVSFEKEIDLREVDFRTTRPFDDYIAYTGMSEAGNFDRLARQQPSNSDVIDKTSIIDLTASMDKNGKLKTKLPPGKWTIMRFGQTSTGAVNWPASKWGIGLECDKFSRPALKKHFDAFSQQVIDKSQKDAPNALQYVEIDSYEMGGQNWTNGFAEMFRKEYGYDLIPFLPTYAGRYVESAEAVAGFSYDITKMYVDLMTENYFKYFTELCNENGLKSYVEPYGNGPVSTLDVSEFIDLPMTEFWYGRENLRRLNGTIHGAHIYGKPIVSAEAFTSRPEVNWKIHPAMTKSLGDKVWIRGVNEMMFHRFVHQANTNVKPGLTMGFWGSHFDRNQTWWMNAGKAWFNYLARGGHLLRQGHHVADVLVFVTDEPHKKGVNRDQLPYPLPNGVNYDCTNANALYDRFQIKDRTLVLPEGNAYKYLMLDKTEIMTLATLRRIGEIARAGVPVIGHPPVRLAGYNRSEAQLKEFSDLKTSIWALPNVTTTFDFAQLPVDFAVEGMDKPFIHRKTEDTDIYFFHNETDTTARYAATFRVAGKVPELWDALTGETRELVNYRSEGQTTRVWLNLDALESAFIIFREPTKNTKSIVTNVTGNNFHRTKQGKVVVSSPRPTASAVSWSDGSTSWIPATTFPAPVDLSTDWTVEFLAEHNYAATVEFPTLTDWKDHENEDIKYYSGTANYKKSFTLPGEKKEGLRYHLDLGRVNVVAEVIVNGRNAGVLWMAPFRADITDFLKPGRNEVEIKLTNQWSNRLIGDERYPRVDGYKNSGYNTRDNDLMPEWYVQNEMPPESPRVTFETGLFYKEGDPLMPSGLIGPVKITYSRMLEIEPGK